MNTADKVEIAMWDAILEKEGLSMGRGTHGSRLSYGARYFDTAKVHDYRSLGHFVRQKSAGRDHAEKILACMAQGLSLRAACKELKLDPGDASRSIKRYRTNFAAGQE